MTTLVTDIPSKIDTPFGTLKLCPLRHVEFGSSVFDRNGEIIGHLKDNYPSPRASIIGFGSSSWDTLVYVHPNSSGQPEAPAVDPDIYRFVTQEV